MTWQRRFFLLYFQEFINEFLFFSSQDFFPTISLCLSQRNSWYFPRYVHSCNLLRYSILVAAYPLCTLRPVHCFGLHFDCFVLLPVAWVLTSLARDTFWVRFNLLPLSCHYDCYILDTIFVKQYCPRSSFHNFFRSVSCTQYLSWDRADNVLRVNLTLTSAH